MRQRRDKSGHGPEYRHIPKDAAGVPAFLILPDGVGASYERRMSNCKACWEATGDPWALSEAHTLVSIHRQAPPAWLDEAIYRLADRRRTKAHTKRAREAMIRSVRYQAVRDVHDHDGLTWEEAYEAAERVLAEIPAVKASANVMRKAYMAVKRDMKAGRGGRYFTPHRQNRKKLASSRA
jgi:hypothetical protein